MSKFIICSEEPRFFDWYDSPYVVQIVLAFVSNSNKFQLLAYEVLSTYTPQYVKIRDVRPDELFEITNKFLKLTPHKPISNKKDFINFLSEQKEYPYDEGYNLAVQYVEREII